MLEEEQGKRSEGRKKHKNKERGVTDGRTKRDE
jgi:hypothetical protein